MLEFWMLLTTCNTPGVWVDDYINFRYVSIIYVLFLLVGIFCFLNIVLAIFYLKFKGLFAKSLLTQKFRFEVNVRLAFLCMQHYCGGEASAVVPKDIILAAIDTCPSTPYRVSRHVKTVDHGFEGKHNWTLRAYREKMWHLTYQVEAVEEEEERARSRATSLEVSSAWIIQFGALLRRILVHPAVDFLGSIIALVNIIILSLSVTQHALEDFRHDTDRPTLEYAKILPLFGCYYMLEQILFLWAHRWRRCVKSYRRIMDFILSLLVTGLLVAATSLHKEHDRIAGIYIMKISVFLLAIKVSRIVPIFEPLANVALLFRSIARSLSPMLVLMVSLYYTFAQLGMMLFYIDPRDSKQLQKLHEVSSQFYKANTNYTAFNFNDFGSSLITLFNFMVENDLKVFIDFYKAYYAGSAVIFIAIWWIFSVLIGLNMVTAVILDDFLCLYEKVLKEETISKEEMTASIGEGSAQPQFMELAINCSPDDEGTDSATPEYNASPHYMDDAVFPTDIQEERTGSPLDVKKMLSKIFRRKKTSNNSTSQTARVHKMFEDKEIADLFDMDSAEGKSRSRRINAVVASNTYLRSVLHASLPPRNETRLNS